MYGNVYTITANASATLLDATLVALVDFVSEEDFVLFGRRDPVLVQRQVLFGGLD